MASIDETTPPENRRLLKEAHISESQEENVTDDSQVPVASRSHIKRVIGQKLGIFKDTYRHDKSISSCLTSPNLVGILNTYDIFYDKNISI